MAVYDFMRERCPNIKENMKQCHCSYNPCERKGLCCQCLHYRRRNGELPACYFPDVVEKTYDGPSAALFRAGIPFGVNRSAFGETFFHTKQCPTDLDVELI